MQVYLVGGCAPNLVLVLVVPHHFIIDYPVGCEDHLSCDHLHRLQAFVSNIASDHAHIAEFHLPYQLNPNISFNEALEHIEVLFQRHMASRNHLLVL